MNLTNPAYTAAVAYLVLIIIILLSPSSTLMQDTESNKSQTFSSKILSVILLLVPIALSIYSINCFVVGGCVVWSWIHAISVLLWVLLLVLALIISNKKCNGGA